MARTPNTSILEWMGIEDSNGVNIANYHLMYKAPGLDPVAAVAMTLITIISMIMSTLLGAALGLSSLITQSSVMLEGLANFTQLILDAVHSIINPIVIAFIAFCLVISRQLLPDYVLGKDKYTSKAFSGVKNFKGVRIGGADYSTGGKTTPSRVIDIIFRGLVVMCVVVLISANPFALIVRAMDFVGSIGSTIAGQSEGGVLNYATSMYQVLFSLINFGSIPDECLSVYSNDMVNGTSNTWACVGQVEPKAGFDHVFLALLALVVAGTMIMFLWKSFLQGSLFLAYVIWDFITIPYTLSWTMVKSDFDEDSRSIYDFVFEKISRLAIYFTFYLIMVFVMTSLPTLGVYVISTVVVTTAGDGAAGAFLTLIFVSVAFYLGSRYVHLIYPRIEGDSRANSWKEFSSTFTERYIPFERDAVTGKFVARDSFNDTVKDNTVIKKVLGAVGIDPREAALTEDHKAVLALSEIKSPDSFARRAVRDVKRAEAHLERDRAILDKRVEDGKISPKRAAAAYDILDARQATLKKIIEGQKKHESAIEDALIAVPAHLAERPEFSGRMVAHTSLVRDVEKAVAREEFEAATGVSADDQDLWNSIYITHQDLTLKKSWLEKDRELGLLSHKAYSDKAAELAPQLDKAVEILNARRAYEQDGARSMTEKVFNPYYDPFFASLNDQDRASLPKNDKRFARRADEHEITRAELHALERKIAAGETAAAFKALTGYEPGEQWDNVESNLHTKRDILDELDRQLRTGDISPKDAAPVRKELVSELEELGAMAAAKERLGSKDSPVAVIDPRLIDSAAESAYVAVSTLPGGRAPSTPSDVLFSLAEKKRRDVDMELRAATKSAVDVFDSLKHPKEGDNIRKSTHAAVAAASSMIPMADAAGHKDSDYEERVAIAQTIVTDVIDNPKSSEAEVTEAASTVSGLLYAPSRGLINDFINVRSGNAMLEEIKDLKKGFAKAYGQAPELPADPGMVIPDVPATWVDKVNTEELQARANVINQALQADSDSEALKQLKASMSEAEKERIAEVNKRLENGSVAADMVVVENAAGEPVEIPRSVAEARSFAGFSDDYTRQFRDTLGSGAEEFVDTLRTRLTEGPALTVVSSPLHIPVRTYTDVEASSLSMGTIRSSIYEAARTMDTSASSETPTPSRQVTVSGEGTLAPPPIVDTSGKPTSAETTFTGSVPVVDFSIVNSQRVVDMSDSINRDAALGGNGATASRVLGSGTTSADPHYLYFDVQGDGTAVPKKGVFRDNG